MQIFVNLNNNTFLKGFSKGHAVFTVNINEAIKYRSLNKCLRVAARLQKDSSLDSKVMMLPYYKFGVDGNRIIEKPDPINSTCEFHANTRKECEKYIYAKKFDVYLEQVDSIKVPDNVETITLEELAHLGMPHIVNERVQKVRSN